MLMEDILGYIAGTLTTLCFVPQAIKIIREKQTAGVSLSTYIIFSAGVSIWFAYGLAINSRPIILFNIITLSITAIIIYNLVKYRK